MIEEFDIKYWEEGAEVVAKAYSHNLPLNYLISSGEKRGIAPYAVMAREAMDLQINVYRNEPNFGSNQEMHSAYLTSYRLMFEVALTAMWELYAFEQGWVNKNVPLGEILRLIATKQNDYGPMNIWTFKHHGLVIRMNDKVARLENLASTGREAQNESVMDTFSDLVGYSIIGGMLINEYFLLPLKLASQNDHF